ncbi:hypothetical protein T4C_281 [Trichinella pseudospiralis]|uniref:Uncharacterized protein n=1 Tax=Trichinella pseudospiralis TaxID=6337 RepID=A0A0V1JMG3_TRIPS|nr:hypothetical protein T4C_281 [Trichinella pseudospiralis]
MPIINSVQIGNNYRLKQKSFENVDLQITFLLITNFLFSVQLLQCNASTIVLWLVNMFGIADSNSNTNPKDWTCVVLSGG